MSLTRVIYFSDIAVIYVFNAKPFKPNSLSVKKVMTCDLELVLRDETEDNENVLGM